MAIIYTYPITDPLATDDTVVVTDVSSSNKATKTATIQQINDLGPQGTVKSVGLSMPAAFAVANSPITETGVLAVTTTGGQAGQFLDYTGNWSTPVVVDSLATTDGSFIDLTPNAATTGNVTVTADLSATGTPSNTTFLRGDNAWVEPEMSITVEDDGDPNKTYTGIETINFTGAGISVGNPSTGQVDVEVLPRLNHGFSPFPIYQGSDTITIQSYNSLAIAGQAICDIAAGQLTVARIFAKLPADCVIKVAVYSGSLTFPSNTKLVYFGRTVVSENAGDPNSSINNIFFIDAPVGEANNWVPVAGTPIVTVIEIDNSTQDQSDPKSAQLLGTTTAASKQAIFQEKLAFQVAPTGAATSIFDVAGTGNTVLGSAITTIGNYANRSVTSKRVCQHFDPEMPTL